MVHTREAPVSVSFSCVASDDDTAQAIEGEAEAYFRLPHEMQLIPPWSPDDRRTPEQRARDLLARTTYRRLESAAHNRSQNAEAGALFKQIIEARRRGDKARVSELLEQQRLALEAAKVKAVAQIRAEGEGRVDLAVIDGYTALNDTRPTTRPSSATRPFEAIEEEYKLRMNRLATSLGPHMGQLPLSGGEPVAGSDRYSAEFGSVSRTGTELRFRWMRLTDPFDGAPALARWLDAKGCRAIRYEFPPAPLDLDPN